MSTEQVERLTRFIAERVDDDERVALAATAREWGAAHGGTPRGSGVYVSRGSKIAEITSSVEPYSTDAEHMARHDPARVLRDVESKRRILAEVVEQIDNFDAGLELDRGSGIWKTTGESDLLLKLLAAPYDSHPDFRPEWGTP